MPLPLHVAVDEIGLGVYHLALVWCVGLLSSVNQAVCIAVSTSAWKLGNNYEPSHTIEMSRDSIVFVGCAIGAVLSGWFADVRGRQPAMFVGVVCKLLAGLFAYFVPGALMYYTCRVCFGLALGFGFTPSVVTLVESAPTKWRGHLVNGSSGIMSPLGLLLASAVEPLSQPNMTSLSKASWHYATMVTVVPCAIGLLVALSSVRESSQFLLSHGRLQDAIEVVRDIAQLHGRDDMVRKLEAENSVARAAAAGANSRSDLAPRPALVPTSEHVSALSGRRRSSRSQAAPAVEAEPTMPRPSLMADTQEMLEMLQSSGFWPVVQCAIVLHFITSFSTASVNCVLPRLLSKQLRVVRPTEVLGFTCALDYAALVLAGLLLAAPNWSYRHSMRGLCLGCCVTIVLLIGVDFGFNNFTFMSLCLAKISLGALHQINVVYFSEVFPTSIRCSANCYGTAASYVGWLAAPLLFEVNKVVPASGPYFIFMASLCMFGMGLVDVKLNKELKGRPLEDFDENIFATSVKPLVLGRVPGRKASSVPSDGWSSVPDGHGSRRSSRHSIPSAVAEPQAVRRFSGSWAGASDPDSRRSSDSAGESLWQDSRGTSQDAATETH
eukprot:TRINITY_DN59360_c0_g1_i1.p1 TRINITY_DN59360_c0_g1~~TRINITY_DN59360_c0_g1_i1.p1  ORF type:complete len:608 (+),score=103.08 TRINITY_DN59360_c0_g1_i1:179-2002(+)